MQQNLTENSKKCLLSFEKLHFDFPMQLGCKYGPRRKGRGKAFSDSDWYNKGMSEPRELTHNFCISFDPPRHCSKRSRTENLLSKLRLTLLKLESQTQNATLPLQNARLALAKQGSRAQKSECLSALSGFQSSMTNNFKQIHSKRTCLLSAPVPFPHRNGGMLHFLRSA